MTGETVVKFQKTLSELGYVYQVTSRRGDLVTQFFLNADKEGAYMEWVDGSVGTSMLPKQDLISHLWVRFVPLTRQAKGVKDEG